MRMMMMTEQRYERHALQRGMANYPPVPHLLTVLPTILFISVKYGCSLAPKLHTKKLLQMEETKDRETRQGPTERRRVKENRG